MEVHPTQLIPQCIIVDDVMGRTNRAIIQKDTVLNELHIEFLQKFFIDKVEVAEKLATGEPYHPKVRQDYNGKQANTSRVDSLSLWDHYEETVSNYKHMFQRWQSGSPVDMQEVRTLIVPLLERIDEFGLALLALYKHVDQEDYFYHHSVATSILSTMLAKKMGIKKEWLQIGIAAFLAESGMAKVHPSIIYKEGMLTEADFNEIKKHPTYSYRYIEKTPSLSHGAKLAILQHHERLDGTGYPLGVKDDKIHKYAKIIAICDTYHAMTSVRDYRKRLSPFATLEQMEQDKFQKFDQQILKKFIRSMAALPLGTKVRLSNQAIGEIVHIELTAPTRPIIRLETSNELLSLKITKDISIEDVLS